jgi:hypothetical protein
MNRVARQRVAGALKASWDACMSVYSTLKGAPGDRVCRIRLNGQEHKVRIDVAARPLSSKRRFTILIDGVRVVEQSTSMFLNPAGFTARATWNGQSLWIGVSLGEDDYLHICRGGRNGEILCAMRF